MVVKREGGIPDSGKKIGVKGLGGKEKQNHEEDSFDRQTLATILNENLTKGESYGEYPGGEVGQAHEVSSTRRNL